MLKNVVNAIVNPFGQICLTFMLFIILAYYFSIFGYSFLHEHYIYSDDSGLNACENLLTCVMVTFDWAFKETGAVGSFLNANWYNATTPK